MTERSTNSAKNLSLSPSGAADRSFGGVVKSVFERMVSVLPFVGSSRGAVAPSVQTYVLKRPSPWRWQILIFVILPTVISAIYFGFIASSRYTSETQAVVSAESDAAGSLLQGLLGGGIGGLLGGGGGGTTNQGQILVAFVQSTEMLQELEDKVGFSKLYTKPEIDFFSRLRADSPFERRYDYFKRRVSVEWDGQSQIVKIRVAAFDPVDAQNILKAIISLSEVKLNAMAIRQHRDLVNFAESELGRAEDRLSKARLSVEDFRSKNSDIDPIASAQAVGTLVSSIQEELASARGKKAESLAFMKPDSPQVLAAEARIAELENQTKSELSGLAGPSENTLSDRVSKYESLLIEEEFARTAYTSAMAYFESARAKAIQSSSYVLDFVPPFLPEYPTEPKPLKNTIVVFLACLLLLGVGNLVVISIREQARF